MCICYLFRIFYLCLYLLPFRNLWVKLGILIRNWCSAAGGGRKQRETFPPSDFLIILPPICSIYFNFFTFVQFMFLSMTHQSPGEKLLLLKIWSWLKQREIFPSGVNAYENTILLIKYIFERKAPYPLYDLSKHPAYCSTSNTSMPWCVFFMSWGLLQPEFNLVKIIDVNWKLRAPTYFSWIICYLKRGKPYKCA